jgi:hypothetical protein
MDRQHPYGVAGTEHSADIVGVVDVFEHDGQVVLAPVEDVLDPLLASFSAWPAGRFRRLFTGELSPVGG